MANSNKTQLDANQCIVGAYDGVEESQRVSIVNSVEYAIELSAADGDSVTIFKDSQTVCQVTANGPPVGADVTSVAIDASNYTACSIFSNINGNPAASGYVILQGSCSDTGSNWHDLSDLIYAGKRPPAASTSLDATAKQGNSGVIEISARRIRLLVPAAGKPTTGTVTYSVVMRT